MPIKTSLLPLLVGAILSVGLPSVASAQMGMPMGAGAAEGATPHVPWPAEMPKFGKDRPLPVLNIKRSRLPNGLEVWVLPRNGIPRVDVSLVFRNAGQAVDTSPGFATFLASTLTSGTRTKDELAVAQAFQAIGGKIEAFGAQDGIGVAGAAITSKAPELFKLMAEVVRTPTFPDDKIALAKENSLQELKASATMPGYESGYEFLRVLLGDHPYARTQPTEASTRSITAQALRDAHAQRFRPDRALLIITGRIDAAEAQRLATAAFGDWKATGAPLPLPPMARTSTAPRKVMMGRTGSVQSNLYVGTPAPPANSPDVVALKVANDVLGGGTTSRLFWKLREQKGYTYGARSTMNSLRLGGYRYGSAAVRNEVTGAALADMLGEYRRMGTELVPNDELDGVKRGIVGFYILSNQLQGSVAGNLASNWLMGLPPEYMANYVNQVQKVTPQQVKAVSARWLDPAVQTILVDGDPSVSSQLKSFGTFETKK